MAIPDHQTGKIGSFDSADSILPGGSHAPVIMERSEMVIAPTGGWDDGEAGPPLRPMGPVAQRVAAVNPKRAFDTSPADSLDQSQNGEQPTEFPPKLPGTSWYMNRYITRGWGLINWSLKHNVVDIEAEGVGT